MVDKNSYQYLRSSVKAYCSKASDGSLTCEKEINVSGNSSYGVALLTNDL